MARAFDGPTAYSYLPAGTTLGNGIIYVQTMTQRCTSFNEGKRTALIHVGFDVDDTPYDGSALSKDTDEIINFKCWPILKVCLTNLTKLGKLVERTSGRYSSTICRWNFGMFRFWELPMLDSFTLNYERSNETGQIHSAQRIRMVNRSFMQ